MLPRTPRRCQHFGNFLEEPDPQALDVSKSGADALRISPPPFNSRPVDSDQIARFRLIRALSPPVNKRQLRWMCQKLAVALRNEQASRRRPFNVARMLPQRSHF